MSNARGTERPNKYTQESSLNKSLVYKINSWHAWRMFWTYVSTDILIFLLLVGGYLYQSGLYKEQDNLLDVITKNPSGLSIPLPNIGIKVHPELAEPIHIILTIISVIFVCQVIGILLNLRRDSYAIRKKLRPIDELTRTALSINNLAGLTNLTGSISNIDADKLHERITVNTTQPELRDIAAAINAMLDRIDEAYGAQIRFVSDASHELRTPIAVIQGYANLLDRWGKDDPKALAESIDAIKSEADNMKNLVEQLLFLARSDNDTMKLNIQSVDMTALAKEIKKETEMIDTIHVFDFEIEDEVTMMADEQLIKQALRIFLDNSIKYTPSGEQIALKIKKENDNVTIKIQDSGIGIPESDVSKIFDRFFRADESRARKTGGTGLGLSIAKWIIAGHNGNIEVISRLEIGTRITIRFPYKTGV